LIPFFFLYVTKHSRKDCTEGRGAAARARVTAGRIRDVMG
jgi:hypothetical protein